MSRSIDERVVEMRFDNKEFERNAKTTLGTLGRLKAALNNSNAPASAFENLQRVAGRVDLSNISNSVDALSHRFSAMGIVGMTVLQDLTRAGIRMATNLANITIGQITSGGYSRAQKIEDARFTLDGLLKDSAKVQAVMDNVDAAVSGTAYSYDAAAAVAAQFAATGLEAGETMEANLKAVAGVAAMTNSSYEEIGHIFTTVSGQGRLMGMQLTQLSTKGMNAAATLAKYLNTTEENVRDMVSKGKISFQTFADAMYDAFGEQAGKANETFTGVMSNIRAALSRTGAGFYAPLIARNSDVVKMLQQVRYLISDVFNKSEFWLTVQKDVTEALLKASRVATTMLKNFDLKGLIQDVYDIYNTLKGLIPFLKTNLKSVGAVLRGVGFLFGDIAERAKVALSDAFSFVNTNDLTKSISAALMQFDAFVTSIRLDTTFIQNAIDTMIGVVVNPLLILFELFKDFVDVMKPVGSVAVEIIKLLASVGAIIFDVTGKYLDAIRKSSNVFGSFSKTVQKIFGPAIEKLREFRSYLDTNRKSIGEKFFKPEIFKNVSQFTKSIAEAVIAFKPFEKLKELVEKAIGKINPLLESGKAKILGFWDAFSMPKSSGTGLNGVVTLADRIRTVFSNLWGFMKSAGEKIWSFIAPVFKGVGDLVKSITFEDVKEVGIIGLVLLLSQSFKNLMDTTAQLLATFRGTAKGGLLGALIGDWGPMITTINTTLIQVKNSFIKFQGALDAGILKTIAISIGILALSLIALALIPSERLYSAVIAMAACAAILSTMMKTMSTVMKGTKGLTGGGKATAMLLGVAASMILVGSALSKIGKLDTTQIVTSMLAMLAIMYIMVEFVSGMALIDKYSQSFNKGKSILMLLGVSASLILVASAIKKLGTMDATQLGAGIIALFATMFALVGGIIAMVRLAPQLEKGAGILLAMGASIFLIATSMSKLAKLGFEDIIGAMLAMTMVMVPMFGMIAMLQDIDTSKLVALAGIVLAINILSNTIKKLAKVGDQTAIVAAAASIGGLMVAMAAITLAMGYLTDKLNIDTSKLLGMAGVMIVMALAVRILAPALTKLAAVDPLGLSVATGNLITALAGLAVAMARMKKSIAGAAALVIAAVAINMLIPPLMIFGTMWGPAAIGMTIIGVSLFALVQAATAIQGAIGGMLTLSLTIIAISAGVALFSAGVLMLATAFAIFAAAAIPAANGFKVLAITFVTLLPVLVTAFIGAMKQFLIAVIEFIPTIVIAFVEGIVTLAEAIAANAPRLLTAISVLIIGVCTVLRDAIPAIVSIVVELLVAVMATINENLPIIVEELFKFVVGVINGLADAIIENEDAIRDAVRNLINKALLSLILSGLKELGSIMPGVLTSPLNKMIDSAQESLRGKELSDAGSEAADNMAAAMANSDAADKAGKKSGQDYLEGFKNTFSGLLPSDTGLDKMFSNVDMSLTGDELAEQFGMGLLGTDGEKPLNIGSEFGSGILTGIAGNENDITQAGTDFKDLFLGSVQDEEAFSAAGDANLESLLGSFTDNTGKVEAAGKDISKAGSDAASDKQGWISSGENSAAGYAEGIDNKEHVAAAAGGRLGKAALKAAENELGIRSPSKAFNYIGRMSDAGFANGLEEYAYLAGDATEAMGESAITTLSKVMGNLSDFAEPIEYTPQIRPVLDLSSVQNGTGSIGQMLDRNRQLAFENAYAFDANFGSENAKLLRSMEDQAALLDSIRQLLATQEIRLDSGQLVGGIASKMDNALGVRAIRAGRGN